MHFYTTLIAAMAAVGTISATPVASSEMETATLWNGTAHVQVKYFARGLASRSLFSKRATLDCQGSNGCSTTQEFKDDCSNAYFKVEDTTYTAQGTGSGVCSGTCGLFVAGPTSCTARGTQLSQAYNDIRQNGCEACGREFDYGDGAADPACALQVDYVEGCTA